MVIDDQHGRAHTPIVAEITPGRIVASTSPLPVISVQARTRNCGQPRFARARPPTASVGESIHRQQEDPMRKLAIVAAALTTLGLTGLSVPAQAKAPGPNGQIAFSRYDPAFGDDATYTMNPDGSNVRPLFPSFASTAPHWSPDGTHVAVISLPGAVCPPNCTGSTVIINSGTGTYRVLPPPDLPALSTACSLSAAVPPYGYRLTRCHRRGEGGRGSA
jgi:hypothetical protein